MSKLLFDEQPLVVDKQLATLIGLNEAMVLQQIHYWVEINKKVNKNFHEGQYWTYNSIEEWHKEFPFWSESTVKRTLTKLRERNLLITDNFNKQRRDRTLWYTINYDELQKIADKVEKEEGAKEFQNEERTKEDSEESTGTETKDESIIEPAKLLKKEKGIKESELKPEEKLEEDKNKLHKVKMTKCKRSKCANAKGQNDPMDQVNLTRPLPETYTETYTENNNNNFHPNKGKCYSKGTEPNVVVENHIGDEEIGILKRKIESVTGSSVIEINLINYLKRSNGIKELEKAIKNYPSISQGILQNGKDISNPVGLLFYIAENNVKPPTGQKATGGLSKQNSFNHFEQHHYEEGELDYLFMDLENL